MAKRTASNELNHLNWNQEDEPEEAGEFKRASDEALQKRVIKTARRRNPISSGETPKSSVFGNFSGFAAKPAPPPTAAFSFLNNLSKPNEANSTANGSNMLSQKVTNSPLLKLDSKMEDKQGEYLAKIKALNESVSNWIKTKVDQNPYINLKPIFKDYEKHFEDIEKNKNKESENPKSDYSTFSFKPLEQKEVSEKQSPSNTFVFGVPNDKSPIKNSDTLFKMESKEDKKPVFSFGAPKDTNNTKTFTFGIPTSTPSTMFSLGSNPSTSNTFTLPTSNSSLFSSNITSNPPRETDKNEEDEEEPPKNDFTPVVEEGHVYTIKCKVFVKQDGKFGDRGVGTLYLKPVADSEKFQLIVRADTSLGKVLCNFILSQAIPIKKLGKKDVMLVTLPTPDSKPPPTPILIRVKSPEEADELFNELEKYKK